MPVDPTDLVEPARAPEDPFLTGVDLPSRVEQLVGATERLAELVGRTGLRRLSVTLGDVSWQLDAPEPEPAAVQVAGAGGVAVAAVPVVAAVPPAPAVPPGHDIAAPLVGVFYRSPGPGRAAFVEVGDTVEVGQQVAIVEAMKMMNEVVADRRGVVSAVHAGDGEVVEFGQALFTVGGE